MAAAKAASIFDFDDQVSHINVPTLVIGGDQERSFDPEAMLKLASRIPNAAFCMIPGTSHCAHLEKPEIFNQIVADFLLEGRFNFEMGLPRESQATNTRKRIPLK